MHQSPYNLVVMVTVLASILFAHTTVTAQEEYGSSIPDWVTVSAAEWLEGEIADGEFWGILKAMLIESGVDRAPGPEAATSVSAIPVTGPVRAWIENKTAWWTDDRLTDEQFLRAVGHMSDAGYLEGPNVQDIADITVRAMMVPNGSIHSLPLENILLTEREIDAITKESKWRFVTTEQDFDKTDGVADSIRILSRDISRVYEPIFNKYKVPTMSMQVTKLANRTSVDDYWTLYTNQTRQEILESAHMTSRASDGTECIFRYSDIGAVTACTRDNIVIQVVIYDMHNEHYQYKEQDMELDETEPTTSIMDGIIKKIGTMVGVVGDDTAGKLHNLLQRSPPSDIAEGKNMLLSNSTLDVVTSKGATGTNATGGIGNAAEPKQKDILDVQRQSADPENSTVYGMAALSCVRDDFGTVTITGSYNNDGMTREQVDVTIVFVDWHDSIIGNATISFTDLIGFETKRFLGHAKWNENFATCLTVAAD